jgi:phosphatidate cytidylyltransferase
VTPPEALPEKDEGHAGRRTPEVFRRLVSAFILAAIALGAVIASPWSFLILVFAASLVLAWEWGRLTRGTSFDGAAFVQAAIVGAVATFGSLQRPDLAILLLAAASVTMALGSFASTRPGWAVAGLIYAALPAWALMWLRSDPEHGAAAVLYLFAVAWTTDTASYAGGRSLGGPKLAPHISPKKTWSGFIVGILVSALVGYTFALVLGGTNPWDLALIGVVLALACQGGDLVESAVKRHFGAKDMSNIIPGHGGLFDRIDSLLFASVLAALIALRNPAHPADGLLLW